MNKIKRYCFNSSVFITSWRIYYSPESFSPLWAKFAELINEGRICVPKEVEKEIINGKDDLAEWFKKQKECVKPYTKEQLAIVQEIVGIYPKVSQYHKVRPFHADPFIVALAKVENLAVVTFEGNNGSSDNPSIPLLCSQQGVKCITLSGFFKEESISFQLS